MTDDVDFACPVCSEEFIVSAEAYRALSSVVQCPCCGSTDLVLLVLDEEAALRLGHDAAA